MMLHMFPFKENHRYPTTKIYIFKSSNVCSVNYGTESLSHLGPKICLLPDDLKNIKSLNAFKINIKQWRPTNCLCKLCKVYLPGVGYIESR